MYAGRDFLARGSLSEKHVLKEKTMLDQLTQLEHEALAALHAVNDKDALETWR